MTNRKIVIVAIVAVVMVAGLTVWISTARFPKTRSPKTVAFVFSGGIGNTTTGKFPLEKGQLWFVVTTCGKNHQHYCSIWLIDNEEDKVIRHMERVHHLNGAEPAKPRLSGTIYDIEKQGDYRFDIGANCGWTISVIQPVPENREFF